MYFIDKARQSAVPTGTVLTRRQGEEFSATKRQIQNKWNSVQDPALLTESNESAHVCLLALEDPYAGLTTSVYEQQQQQ